MRRKCSQISIFFGNLDLEILAIRSFQCPKYCCFAKRFDMLVHVQFWVRIWYRHCVQCAVVESNQRAPSFLERKRSVRPVFWAGSITTMASFPFISCVLSSLALGLRCKSLNELVSYLNYCVKLDVQCFTEPGLPVETLSNGVSILINMLQHAEYSSGKGRSSPQLVFKFRLIPLKRCGKPLARHSVPAAYRNQHLRLHRG